MDDFPASASLDQDRLEVIADGDWSMATAVLEVSLETTTETLAILEAAIDRRDRALLVNAAHRLRGASSSAGVPFMFSLAARIEGGALPLADADMVAMARPVIEALHVELVRVREAAGRLSSLEARCL